MPTVLRVAGFSVSILFPPREHKPAHVHVIKAGKVIVINLPYDGAEQSIRKNDGMARLDAVRAWRIVEENTEMLVHEWRKIHG